MIELAEDRRHSLTVPEYMEMEELAQAEKEARRARLKSRMLWVIIVADVLLFGYAVYEIIALILSIVK